MKKTKSVNIRRSLIVSAIIGSVLVVLNITLSYFGKSKGESMLQVVEQINEPLLQNLKELEEVESSVIHFANSWLSSQRLEDKMALKNLVSLEYTEIKVALGKTVVQVTDEDIKKSIKTILSQAEQVSIQSNEIMNLLKTSADFEDYEKLNFCNDLVKKSIEPAIAKSLAEIEQLISEVSLANKTYNSKREKLLANINIIAIIGYALLLVIIVFGMVLYPKNLLKELSLINKQIFEMGHGNLPQGIKGLKVGELIEVQENLNIVRKAMSDIQKLALEIGQGNYDSKIDVFESKGDVGHGLADMKVKLTEIAKSQEEQRKQEELNTWINAGMAKFNEILRVNNENIEELSYNLVKELVKYSKSVIGGVYIAQKNDEDKEKLIMSGLFAYERRRYVEKALEVNEGLVGTVYVERHLIHMKEIPSGYINISSGLGEAAPNEILIVPMLYNDECYGAIEMATLDEYTPAIIEFVERISEALASTISSVVTNMETSKLLKDSQEQSEILRSQEEELRQNMEELQAAQDEMHRKQKDLEKTLEEAHKKDEMLKKTKDELEQVKIRAKIIMDVMPMAVYLKDLNQVYIGANQKFVERIGAKNISEVLGKTDYELTSQHKADVYRKEDEALLKGGEEIKNLQKVKKDKSGKEIKITINKVPILDGEGNVIGIFGTVEEIY